MTEQVRRDSLCDLDMIEHESGRQFETSACGDALLHTTLGSSIVTMPVSPIAFIKPSFVCFQNDGGEGEVWSSSSLVLHSFRSLPYACVVAIGIVSSESFVTNNRHKACYSYTNISARFSPRQNSLTLNTNNPTHRDYLDAIFLH